jgi:glycosyltransferase involved in cell wall biosynthesis
LVTSYAPRRHDLAGPAVALTRELAVRHETVVCAVDRHALEYPDEVCAVIAEDRPADYTRAARILVECGVDAVLLEHDEHLYGGAGGAHVLELVRHLGERSVPLLVRLHGLPQPGRAEGRVVAGLVEAASAVLVPSAHAAGLVAGRIAGADRVVVVPPGAVAHTAAPSSPSLIDRLSGDGRVMTVLGPIRPERGLERTLQGVAKVAADHPDVRLVLAETGFDATGQGVSSQDERRDYLSELWELAHELGVAERTTMLAERLGPAERAWVLQRTTVLLAPWLPAERPAIGVLGEAMTAGCAMVTAPHPYATEVLATGAGVVLTGDDPEGLSQAVGRLLVDSAALAGMRQQARAEGPRFAWPAVAAQIAEVAASVAAGVSPSDGRVDARRDRVPVVPIRLDGLHLEVAGTGEIARLGIVAAALAGRGCAPVSGAEWMTSVEWSRRAVAGLTSGDAADDATAPAGWWVRGLVALAGPGLPPAVRDRARAGLRRSGGLGERAAATVDDAALAVLGLASTLPYGPLAGPPAQLWTDAVARLTTAGWGARRWPTWPWLTDRVTGVGVRVPHALILAGAADGDDDLVRLGQRALDWYIHRVGLGEADGVLALPDPGGETAADVAAVVEALVGAYTVTGARRYGRLARRAFGWYAGLNRSGDPAYDVSLGRCRDRVGRVATPVSVPATLAYLGAALALRDAGLVRVGR